LNHRRSLSRKAAGLAVKNWSASLMEQESQTSGGCNHGWQHPGQVAESIRQHFSTLHLCSSSVLRIFFDVWAHLDDTYIIYTVKYASVEIQFNFFRKPLEARHHWHKWKILLIFYLN
jgi:hypothetical protein